MAWKIFKKIGAVVKDVVNLGVQPLVTAYNSVSGDDVKLEYSTSVAKTIAKVNTTVDRGVNTVFKSFADTITGGYATKAVNLIRKDENKETAFHYNESKGVEFANIIGSFFGRLWGPSKGSVTNGTYPVEDVTKQTIEVVKKYWWVGVLGFVVWLFID